jgi:hypothetical protein
MTQQTTILIAGSRTLKETAENLRRLEMALDEIHAILSTQHDRWDYPSLILHGGAKGADQLAGQLARKLNLQEEVRLPNYDMWNGNWAPLKRNLEMIAEAEAVIVIYVKGKAGQGGSGFVAEKTIAAGKHLLELMPDGTTRHTAPVLLF